MQPVDVERSQEFRKCIECWLCQDTCHVIRGHGENSYYNITTCCSEVCLEGIHLTDNGFIPLKERVVDRKFDPPT
jgi:succinate dehydrogenase / fumarate reductase iron-sulfur subunit